MLVVDISFLAIPGVDQGSIESQSIATIVIYMSILSIVGSLVSSVLLAIQSDTQEDSAHLEASFMKRMTCWGVGVNTLGVMFSLPFALIIWA
ncbi:hypothetical protein F5I97DRAFT_464184 [Phlebopus sp. FC_14]|nr:hypothetical protein F5I97DRAFT_464184 [Phlebopus sp. FC_14]